MATKVGTCEAKNKFSELMEAVAYAKRRFLVERRGKPMMALVTVADLMKLEEIDREEPDRDRQKDLEEWLAEADRIRAWWTERLGGEHLPPAAELLREAREEGLA